MPQPVTKDRITRHIEAIGTFIANSQNAIAINLAENSKEIILSLLKERESLKGHTDEDSK